MKVDETFNQITQAIACRPGKDFVHGTSPSVGIPDYDRAVAQHQAYCDALQKCGVSVTILNPGGCFVSNTAVVTEYLAVIGNFSDDSQKYAEQREVASALAGARFLKFITSPGILSGRDVLQLNGRFYINLSRQTNQEGAAQLAFFLNEYGYEVTMLNMEENAVILNTAASYLGRNRILIREDMARHFSFLEYEKIVVPHSERGAANALAVNGTLLMPAGYAETTKEVRHLGLPVLEVNVSEFEKMSGGLGCLSLRLQKMAGRAGIEWPVKAADRSLKVA